VKVDDKGKDWLVYESSPAFSFKCKEVQFNKNKLKTKARINKDDWWMTDVFQVVNYNRRRIHYQNTTVMETGKKPKLRPGNFNCV